jgi:uncharacterized membrane protein YcaP (DUF421 family)
MSREMLASELRAADVTHLGELRRVYLESSGALSIIKRKRATPGLTMRPDMERKLLHDIGADGYFACWSCGDVMQSEQRPLAPCHYCGIQRWESAVNSEHTEAADPGTGR